MIKIRLGTRGSQLALTQAHSVKSALTAAWPDLDVDIITIQTLGDRKQGTAAASQSDKKDWVVDLEQALLEQTIDVAIHSAKDVPYQLEAGTALTSVLTRANPYDCFIGKEINGKRLRFADLPAGAVIGTASLRRRAQLLRSRPDLEVREYRGNVPTRINKLMSGDVAGTLLACAGLQRLEMHEVGFETLSAEQMLPAMNQGILAAQFRDTDQATQQVLAALVDTNTQICWQAERRVAEVLAGDCQSAMALFATMGTTLKLQAQVLLPDGSDAIAVTRDGEVSAPIELANQVAQELLSGGAGELIEQAREFYR